MAEPVSALLFKNIGIVLFLLNLLVGWFLWSIKRATIPKRHFYAMETKVRELEIKLESLPVKDELHALKETLARFQEKVDRIDKAVDRIGEFLRTRQ